jgi:uncharacterized protein (DUF2141 family)
VICTKPIKRIVAALVVAVAVVLAASGAQQDASAGESQTGSLEIQVQGIKSDKGVLVVALLDSAEMYDSGDKVFRDVSLPIKGGRASVTFDDLPYGTYAVKTFHDKNSNGKLDTNFVGYPKESFGFSNDAMGKFGPPTFEEAKVELAAETLQIVINSK